MRYPETVNLLEREKSPYLQQHAKNPVWWKPWGEEALEQAQKENKIIFLSIGYSTCHWCHVMEKESFEDNEVAEHLNRGFVSIKIDREERPDVDDLYMSALQHLQGRGGWPLSMWLTPEGKPFFGGTYFPKKQFIHILQEIERTWNSEPDKIKAGASRFLDSLKKTQEFSSEKLSKVDGQIAFQRFLEFSESAFDSQWGGFGGAPKFPQTMNLMLLLRLLGKKENASHDDQIKHWLNLTLTQMASQGLVDHLGGGFHRYSTDAFWSIPHFEKMLYDNALLSLTYIEAFQKFKNPEYERVVHETLSYVAREMTHSEGGFFSAEDADSLIPELDRKEEGYFYTFSSQELRSILSPSQFSLLSEVYEFTEHGNFEGRNHLFFKKGVDRSAYQNKELQEIRKVLLEHRSHRPRPHLDRKIITAWNGLMIASFAKAYRVFKNPEYLEAAVRSAEFLETSLWKEGQLFRRWCEGESRYCAYSEDYTCFIFGLIELYQASLNEHWLEFSYELQHALDRRYWDSDQGGYFRDSGEDQTLLFRMKDDYDGVQPTANSLGAYNLLRLSDYFLDSTLKDRADQIFHFFSNKLKKFSHSLPMMLIALHYRNEGASQVIISGEKEHSDFHSAVRILGESFQPNLLVGHSPGRAPLFRDKKSSDGGINYYTCQGFTCQAPLSRLSDLEKWINDRNDG